MIYGSYVIVFEMSRVEFAFHVFALRGDTFLAPTKSREHKLINVMYFECIDEACLLAGDRKRGRCL